MMAEPATLALAAFAGLLVAVGGVVLWALTTPVFRRRERSARR